MKVTQADIDLANRFPKTRSVLGYGMNMMDAKVSPTQLDRLLKLQLIEVATNNYCGGQLNDNPGKGSFLRQVTTFIRKK